MKELWKRKSARSYVTHTFIRCSRGRSGRCGGVQVIKRWYRTSADLRRGADSQPPVCVRRWFHAGASGHPFPKTGHARGAAHRGQSFTCVCDGSREGWTELVSQNDCFFANVFQVSQQTAKCIPALVCPELTEQIRREVAAALHRRKGEFPCYFFTDLVTFTLPAGDHSQTSRPGISRFQTTWVTETFLEWDDFYFYTKKTLTMILATNNITILLCTMELNKSMYNELLLNES